jgi:hypothetical protein
MCSSDKAELGVYALDLRDEGKRWWNSSAGLGGRDKSDPDVLVRGAFFLIWQVGRCELTK